MAVNGGFTFDNPWILTGMIVIIPLALSDFISPLGKRIRGRLPEPVNRKLLASRLFFYLFLALLITAFAGPRLGAGPGAGAGTGTALPGEHGRAVDVVIAIDVSRSMLACDGNTEGVTRLKQGALIVTKAVAALPGTRFAVAVSRNRGIVAVPLTWDDGAVLAFLETVDASALTGRGTNLESLLDAGAGAFDSSYPSGRVILLVSDGEALTGSIKNAVTRCAGNGIMITSILTGSDEGAPVPGGEDIVSRRDAATMKTAAGQTGGIFIDANREDAADVLIGHLRSMSRETERPGSGETNRELWLVFVLSSIAAYGLSKLFLLKMPRAEPRRHGGHGEKKRVTPCSPCLCGSVRCLLISVLILLVTACTNPTGKLLIIEANFLNSRGRFTEAVAKYTKALEYEDAAPYAEYGLGSLYFSIGEEDAALNSFTEAGNMLDSLPSDQNRELRYRICYNTGIVLFGRGNFTGAAEAFRDALRIDGRKTEAKRNLELSIMSSAGQNVTGVEHGDNEGLSAMFDYIRQKELNQWTNREWHPEEDSLEPDY